MKNFLIATVAATALLAACGGKDKTGDATEAASESITVGDVKLPGLNLRAGDASEATAVLTAFSLQESGAGRVSYADSSKSGADATFTDVVISVDEDGAPINVGTLAFKGLDMTDAGASFSQMSLSNITVTPDGDDEGTVSIADMQLTNPSPQLAAWVASLMGQGDPAPFPDIANLSFDGLGMSGFSVDAEGIDELQAFTISKIDFRELSATGLGSMVLEGLNLNAGDDDETVVMSIGSIKMAGLGEVMMKALTAGLASGSHDGDPEDMLGEIMSLASSNPGDPGYDAVIVDAMSMDISGVAFDLPRLEAAVTRDNQGRAIRSVTKPFKMSLKADPEGELGSQMAGPLALMGYEVLNFSGAADTRLDPDADTVESRVGDNYLALEDGFKLSIGGAFGGLSDYYTALSDSVGEDADVGPEATLAALGKLSLNQFELRFEDDSIVDRAFTTAAAMSGQEAAAMRSQAIAGAAALPFLAASAGVDGAMATELGGAIASFLETPGTLTIKMDPTTPLTATDFEDPTQLTKTRLGFSASSK